jgi:hypothetical protein
LESVEHGRVLDFCGRGHRQHQKQERVEGKVVCVPRALRAGEEGKVLARERKKEDDAGLGGLLGEEEHGGGVGERDQVSWSGDLERGLGRTSDTDAVRLHPQQDPRENARGEEDERAVLPRGQLGPCPLQRPKIASQGVRRWDAQAGGRPGPGADWLRLVGRPGDPHRARRANEQQQPACQ